MPEEVRIRRARSACYHPIIVKTVCNSEVEKEEFMIIDFITSVEFKFTHDQYVSPFYYECHAYFHSLQPNFVEVITQIILLNSYHASPA